MDWINRNNELSEVIFRKSDKTIIMEMFHDNKGHLGIEKTYNAISEIYYWKNVYSDVSDDKPLIFYGQHLFFRSTMT
jgi:hypothetical protein